MSKGLGPLANLLLLNGRYNRRRRHFTLPTMFVGHLCGSPPSAGTKYTMLLVDLSPWR